MGNDEDTNISVSFFAAITGGIMGTSGKIITAVLFVVVLAGGAIWLNNTQKTKDKSASPSSQTGSNAPSSTESMAVASTITYDGNGFNLSSDTIKSGDKVKVVNNSSAELEFDSDPHPVHTDNEELNIDRVAPGKSKTFIITKTGTWGFHNHLNASQNGSITVE